jgi:hypothetical protein
MPTFAGVPESTPSLKVTPDGSVPVWVLVVLPVLALVFVVPVVVAAGAIGLGVLSARKAQGTQFVERPRPAGGVGEPLGCAEGRLQQGQQVEPSLDQRQQARE